MIKIQVLLVALIVPALGQTSADLSAKFPPVAAYRVHSDVLMEARFAADGQVCEMTLQKRQKTYTNIVLGGTFRKPKCGVSSMT